MLSNTFLMFDVESVGLHGEGFAVGYVVINRDGLLLEEGCYFTDSRSARGSADNRKWVEKNIPELTQVKENYNRCNSTYSMRWYFWQILQKWINKGAMIYADCTWPVEANFLSECVKDNPEERTTTGPYPLYDLCTLRGVCGYKPLQICDRLSDELPIHDPLCDARQSARLLIETVTQSKKINCPICGWIFAKTKNFTYTADGLLPSSCYCPKCKKFLLLTDSSGKPSVPEIV